MRLKSAALHFSTTLFLTLSLQQGLQDVEEQFQLLKQKQLNQTIGGEAADRLKRIQAEAEDMQRQMEDRLRQLQGFNHQSNHQQSDTLISTALKKERNYTTWWTNSNIKT